MQLPFLSKTSPQKNFFLSLLVKPDRVGAILFEEINSKLFILATHEVDAHKDTSTLTPEELLAASDRVVSAIEASLPAGASVEKTIFSVPHSWVEEASGPEGPRPGGGKIKKEYLDKLKKVCGDLGLAPVGYLVSIEAVVHFLQDKEGAPVSAIFVEIAAKHVFVYLVRAGKIIEVKSGDSTEGIVETVDALFKKIASVDVLPSKIILFAYKDSEDVQQEFLSHQWPKDVPFLHLPQVSVLEKGAENEAIINGVAQQMDLEVLQDIKTYAETPSPEEKIEETKDDFGFLKEKDVADSPVSKKENSELPEESDEPIFPRSNLNEESNLAPLKKNVTPEMDDDNDSVITQEAKSLAILSSIPNPLNFLKSIKLPKIKSMPLLVAGGGPAKIKIVAILAVVIIALVGFTFAYYNLILSADVTIFADQKAIDKTATVTFSSDESGDDTIKIDTIEEEIKGTDTKNSTGTKETGEKATGSVTLYNKTEGEKNFSKGAIIVGPNSLEFELQEDVKIASTSSFSTTLSSGKGKIAAAKFGKEYNLPSSTNFTIKGSSSSQFIGKNDSAISGGSKKETTVVSKKDLDALLASVTKNLEADAVSKAQQSAGSDQKILPKALSFEVVDKSYSKKEGDEAGSVGISATVKYSIAKYSQSDLQKIIASMANGVIPGTYALQEGDSKVEITDVKVDDDGAATATLKANAVYAPTLESSKLATDIKGKSVTAATDDLKGIAGVTDVSVKFNRQLPFLPQLLPANVKNINIEIKK